MVHPVQLAFKDFQAIVDYRVPVAYRVERVTLDLREVLARPVKRAVLEIPVMLGRQVRRGVKVLKVRPAELDQRAIKVMLAFLGRPEKTVVTDLEDCRDHPVQAVFPVKTVIRERLDETARRVQKDQKEIPAQSDLRGRKESAVNPDLPDPTASEVQLDRKVLVDQKVKMGPWARVVSPDRRDCKDYPGRLVLRVTAVIMAS